MRKSTFSLRCDKLRGDSFTGRLNHNARTQEDQFNPNLTPRADRKRLHLNYHWKNPRYMDVYNTTSLWSLIDQDYDNSKRYGLTKRKKCIPRVTPRRGSTPIETSVAREIILQIGHASDTHEVPDDVFHNFIAWLEEKFLGDTIQYDIHNDEGIKHLHLIVTTWSLKHHENYTKNNLIDNYGLFQNMAYKALKSICRPHGIDIQVPVPKKQTRHKHISPGMYEREILPVEQEKKRIHKEIRMAQAQLDNIYTKLKTEKERFKNLEIQFSCMEQEFQSKKENLMKEFSDYEKGIKRQAKELLDNLIIKIKRMSIGHLETTLEKLHSVTPKQSLKIIRDIEVSDDTPKPKF